MRKQGDTREGSMPGTCLATEEGLAELAERVGAARRGVVFTGAGISTESGIPDFRSPGGIWSRYRPTHFSDFIASPQARAEAWRRKFAVDDHCRGAVPNVGHKAVAQLVQSGHVSVVITQNIDGLHLAAGVPAERLIELHGNGTYARCLGCGTRVELDDVRARFEAHGVAPDCTDCGAPLKAATISFGQAMPEAAMARARDAALRADLFLVLGSSLVVYPAALLPRAAKQSGAYLAIVNREPTELDAIADLVLHEPIGTTMQMFYTAGMDNS
jgi:NAD-dependent deacetylase